MSTHVRSPSLYQYAGPVEVADPAVIEEICRFRVRVWRETGTLAEGAFADGRWRDPIDSHCRHWVVRDGTGSLAAAGRLSIHAALAEVHQAEEYQRLGLELAGPIAAPDRVVVRGSAQGHGLGRRILDAQDQAARAAGARHAVRQASPRMVELLGHCGWRVAGPATPDPRFPGVAFQVVVLDLLCCRSAA